MMIYILSQGFYEDVSGPARLPSANTEQERVDTIVLMSTMDLSANSACESGESAPVQTNSKKCRACTHLVYCRACHWVAMYGTTII